MHRLWRLTLAAVTIALLAGCRGQGGAGSASNSAAKNTGDRAFPPRVHYEMPGARGEKVDLHQFEGRVVVLNFWATWCPPCRYEVPHLIELRRRFDAAKVAIIGVSVDQGELPEVQTLVSRFMARFGINYPVVLDPRFELIQEYYHGDLRTLGVPLTYVIDRQGRVYRTHSGIPQDSGGQPDPSGVLGREVQALLDGS
jgi:peroxiredoxin